MKSIDEIVSTFITDLKKTKEYKKAWHNCNETKDIVFNFKDLQFYNIYDVGNVYRPIYPHIEICMDEEVLLGK
jgi:hypothetical protein